MFWTTTLEKRFVFNPNRTEVQAGLPPRFRVGRKSTVNNLCPRLYIKSFCGVGKLDCPRLAQLEILLESTLL